MQVAEASVNHGNRTRNGQLSKLLLYQLSKVCKLLKLGTVARASTRIRTGASTMARSYATKLRHRRRNDRPSCQRTVVNSRPAGARALTARVGAEYAAANTSGLCIVYVAIGSVGLEPTP